jgi:hypothetical protein
MNADQVRALVEQKFPKALTSPLAGMFAQIAAEDEAQRAVEFARLQARANSRPRDGDIAA